MNSRVAKLVFGDELSHAGVKGMKWGVRKSPTVSTGAGRRRTGSTAVSTKPRKPPAKRVTPKKRTPAQIRKSKIAARRAAVKILASSAAVGLALYSPRTYNLARNGLVAGTFLNRLSAAGY